MHIIQAGLKVLVKSNNAPFAHIFDSILRMELPFDTDTGKVCFIHVKMNQNSLL